MGSSQGKRLRVLILLLILLFVALQQVATRWRVNNWDGTLWAVTYPINADNSVISTHYITQLQESDFDDIEKFFVEESLAYDLPLDTPLTIKLAPPVTRRPPPPPQSGFLATVWWSLKARWWAWSEDTFTGPAADIQLFLLYHDPDTHPTLQHSVGIRNGGYALVNLFAAPEQRGENSVIIAHELMHTLGATDKYDPVSGRPIFPDGYAKPGQTPLYPQYFAELMAGRIANSATTATIPSSLDEVLIGALSAREINWVQE